jgi:hypothetical protein
MYIINEILAIDAIPQTKEHMRYVDAVVGNIEDFQIIDVRMLKDNHSNRDGEYLQILSGLRLGCNVRRKL